jgi:hypothetical protein
MADPSEDGPETTLENVVVAGGANNYRHYVAVLAYFPEIFDCDNLRDLYTLATTDAELLSGSISTNVDIRSAAADLCWRESGNQAWIFALALPILLVFLIIAFIAAFRRSGFQAAIAGVGLSAFMLVYCALVIVHYQAQSNIPTAIQVFGDCDDFKTNAVTMAAYSPSTTSQLALKDGNRYITARGNTNHFDEVNTVSATGVVSVNFARSPARVFGLTPRRAHLCEDDWDYDNRLNTSANLVYGGIAVVAFGLLFVLTAFAYIAFPFLKVVPAANAKQMQATAPLSRGVDYSEYSYSD